MKKNKGILSLVIIFLTLSTLAATPTKIFVYQAFTQNSTLSPNLVIAQRYIGRCFARSLTNPGRNDAWRCQASNVILDPCFEDSSVMACIISPWSHKAAILELDAPIHKKPKSANVHLFEPWALELENGSKCTYLTGASSVIENIRANYACDTYHYTILGKVDRSSASWKVDVYNFNTRNVEKMDIKTAWF